MKIPQVNDILYTKDGRKCGNMVCVKVEEVTVDTIFEEPLTRTRVWLVSDYGNLVSVLFHDGLLKQFYYTYGKADATHKHYNYVDSHPEEFI